MNRFAAMQCKRLGGPRQDQYPDIAFGLNHCTLRWNTHSVGGISLNDFICAAKVQALLD